jgi:Peptidase inhibitor family I36
MRRWIVLLASCLALAMIGGGALAPSAMANREDCPAQWFCLWDGETYGTDMHRWHDNGSFNLADWGFNNRASSGYNNTNRYVVVYEGANLTGSGWCFLPGEAWRFPGTWNNIASSVRISPTSC